MFAVKFACCFTYLLHIVKIIRNDACQNLLFRLARLGSMNPQSPTQAFRETKSFGCLRFAITDKTIYFCCIWAFMALTPTALSPTQAIPLFCHPTISFNSAKKVAISCAALLFLSYSRTDRPAAMASL